MNLKRILYLTLCAALLAGLLALPAMAAGINVDVQTSYEVVLGEELILFCSAASDTGGELSYIWYETATGKLEDMYAVNRGEETLETYLCDTTQLGTRYYLCSVSDGTAAVYSDIITVRVVSDTGSQPVIFTTDSEPVTGGKMTVDPQKTGLSGTVTYAWYRDDQKLSNGTATMEFTEADAGCTFYVTVTAGDSTLKSEPFEIEKLIIPPEIETTKLPEAIVGEKYTAQLKCYDDVDAEFSVYFNPGKSNQFDQTGLTLAEDGKLSGKPAKAGEFTFTVCAANEGGEDYATYTLVVKEPATDPTETTQGTTEPVVIAPAPGQDTPTTPDEDVSVIAPAPDETLETVGETGEGDGGLGLLIVLVIILAVLAAAGAVVVIVILVVKKNR